MSSNTGNLIEIKLQMEVEVQSIPGKGTNEYISVLRADVSSEDVKSIIDDVVQGQSSCEGELYRQMRVEEGLYARVPRWDSSRGRSVVQHAENR